MSEQPRELSCPKCSQPMKRVSEGETEIDRCVGCGGIWFDILEHEDLKAVSGAEALDTGDRVGGRIMNDVRDIDCPVCNLRMIRMVALKKRDIEYEKCSHCSGVFFDAGELAAFKHERGFLDILASALSAGRGR